jgi:hypothetical protein
MDENGVTVTDGLLMAVITQANLYAALERLQAECDKVPQPEDLPSVCEALEIAYAPGPGIVGPDYAPPRRP